LVGALWAGGFQPPARMRGIRGKQREIAKEKASFLFWDFRCFPLPRSA